MALTPTIATYSSSGKVPADVLQRRVTLSNGVNALVAGVVGYQIQIVGIVLVSDTAGNFALRTGADPIITFVMNTVSFIHNERAPLHRILYASNVGGNVNMNVSCVPTFAEIYLQYQLRS